MRVHLTCEVIAVIIHTHRINTFFSSNYQRSEKWICRFNNVLHDIREVYYDVKSGKKKLNVFNSE